jgi:hypothetical protein
MARLPIEVERVPIAAVDPRPSELEDRQLFALDHDEPPWDGMISTTLACSSRSASLPSSATPGFRSSHPSPPDTTDPLDRPHPRPHREGRERHHAGKTTGLATGRTRQP